MNSHDEPLERFHETPSAPPSSPTRSQDGAAAGLLAMELERLAPQADALDLVPQALPSYLPRRPSIEELEARIRELEEKLAEAARGPRMTQPPRISRTMPAPAPSEPRSTAKDLLSSDFYVQQWGRTGMRRRAEQVDEFGLDPQYEGRVLPLLDLLYRYYLRVDTQGVNHIPGHGRCLIVANHSGGPLPYDGLLLRTAVRLEHPAQRELRWLLEDFLYHLPFVGTAMNRLGAVRACQENAERLLVADRLLAVFPEGAKGIGKLYKDRYQLQRFGRGGFIRLCLRTGTPIVPCAIVGAEEANPMLVRVEYMAKTLGIPYLPITPTFPALGLLGLLPAPTKCIVTFGEAIHFEAAPEAGDDDERVGQLADTVRATIQGMLDRTLTTRRSVWFG